MSIPEILARPLAGRIAGLPEVNDRVDNPDISQAVIDAGVKALADGKTHYTDRPGILPLRTWVVEQIADRCDVEISPAQVTITCGHTEARFVSVKILAKPGTLIYCPGNSDAIVGAAHLAGAQITDFLSEPAKISLVYLTDADSKDTVEKVMEMVKEHHWWVIWDMVDGQESYHPAQNADLASRIITLGSLEDKLPGWRIGWIAGSEMAGKLRAFKQSMTICSTSISQWAALGLVEKS